MKNDDFLSRVHEELIISICHNDDKLRHIVESHMKAQHGANWYEPHMKAIRNMSQKISLLNISMLDACKFAEEIRMAYPNSHVNIQAPYPGGDCICKVTWNTQMANYPHYDTYTENGAILAKAALRRKAYNETGSFL